MSDKPTQESSPTVVLTVIVRDETPQPQITAPPPAEETPAVSKKPAASVIDTVKDTLTIVGGAGFVCYALGFITVSINLQSWGIYDLTLLSGRYISVGFCLLLFFAIAVAPPYYLFSAWFAARSTPGAAWADKTSLGKWAASAFLCLVGPAGVSFVIAALLSITFLPDQHWENVKVILGTVTNSFTWLFGQWFALLLWHTVLYLAACLLAFGGNWGWRAQVRGVPNGIWLTLLLIVLVIIATKCYAASYYGAFNQAYGGGQISDVALVIDGDSASAAKLLEVISDANEPVSFQNAAPGLLPAVVGKEQGPAPKTSILCPRIGLLDQNDKSYFLLIYDSSGKFTHSAILERSMVKGLRTFVEGQPIPKPTTDSKAGGGSGPATGP